MKRRYRILRDISLTRKKTGRTVIFKCEYFKESPDDFILIHDASPVKAHATLYPKKLWDLAKTQVPHPGAPLRPEPSEAEDVPPLPGDDDDEVPPEIVKEIEGGGRDKPTEKSPGDLTKEFPGEYIASLKHEVVDTAEAAKRILTMQSHIDANFARDEGERKYKQALARRRMQQHVERAGAGFLPE